MRAAILLALLLPGCVLHRTTIVNVRADDHFDIRAQVGRVELDAALAVPPRAQPAVDPPPAVRHGGILPAPAGPSGPTIGNPTW